MQHWKQHKSTCTTIKKCYDKWKEGESKTLPDGSALDTKEGPCAICLEETITNPVNLPCGHAFCFACVGKYQWSSESDEASCPYCRGEIPNVVGKASERVLLYAARARSSLEGSEEQKKYAKLALTEHDSIVEILKQFEDENHGLTNLYLRVSMLAMTDKPRETIQISKEVLSLNEIYPGILDRDQVAQTKQILAKAYCARGKWDKAESIYRSLLGEDKQRDVMPNADTMIGLSRAMYETQRYDEAIKVGNVAFEKFRFIPGVHKYVALAQKAKGDIDDAKKTMSRAILYEMHWDKDNLQKNRQILRELSSL